MAIFGAITAILPLIEKLIPDTDAREKATAELNRLDQAGELRVMLAQIAANRSEGPARLHVRRGLAAHGGMDLRRGAR